MKKLSLSILLILAMAQASCLRLPLSIDAAPAASDTHDTTVMFQGCESKPTSGYLFCKLQEGAAIDDVNIRIFAPLDTCKRDSCFTFEFLRKDGTIGFSGSIPHDKSFIDVSLTQIIDHTGALLKRDAGEYQVMVRLWWIDPNAQIEKTSRADGLVRVWVVDKDAQFLACNDPQNGWQLPFSEICRADISTQFRVALCGDGCER